MADEQPNSEPLSVRDTLAGQRTDLALQRTIIAADRTMMAWIRTSISMIGFGFSIYKFFEYLRESQEFHGTIRAQAPRNFGMALIILGTLVLLLAVLQHWQFLRQIGAVHRSNIWSLTVITALLVAMIGILALINVSLKAGPL